MAQKDSKLEIKVDLDCHCCCKKIQKVLCKLQEQENIKTISYDKKNGTITISGPFDAEKLIKKLRCMACKVIISVKIIPPPPEEKKKEDPKPSPAPKPERCKVINDIKIVVPDHLMDPKYCEKKPEKPKPPAPKPAPEKPAPEPKPCHPPSCPVCCCKPPCVGYCGGPRCCSCDKVCGCAGNRPPRTWCGTCHGGPGWICEEKPSSCPVM